MARETDLPLIIKLTTRCNNDCIMCSIGGIDEEFKERSAEDVIEILKVNSGDYNKVEFTGGEPTEREDLLRLVKKSESLGYKNIGIATNGRNLSSEKFTNKLVENGANEFTISLHAPDKETNEKITGKKGAFGETLEGIKNVLDSYKVKLSVATVIIKPNYRKLSDLANLLISREIKFWDIANLIPGGKGQVEYSSLCIRNDRLSSTIKKLLHFSNKFSLLSFVNFPRCLFPEELQPNVNYISSREKYEDWGFEDLDASQNSEFYKDAVKTKIEICEKCPYSDKCLGFWKKKLELFGKDVSKRVAKSNLKLQ